MEEGIETLSKILFTAVKQQRASPTPLQVTLVAFYLQAGCKL